MTMKFIPVLPSENEYLIAGPCSAETEQQVLATAHALASTPEIGIFRASLWKPRTRPGTFEGVGAQGLPWLQKVQRETGLKVSTEVANSEHVQRCLDAGVDVLWIGARTSANPFSVQEIATALRSHPEMPILVKNPVNPDYKLWIGAIERLYEAGLRRIAAVHRGFSAYADSKYRNAPRWQIALDLMQEFPSLEVFCDISHICGRRDILTETAQKAYDLNFRGLMVEVHPQPDEAWSDAAQQITPQQLVELLQQIIRRPITTDDPDFLDRMRHIRHQIDELDEEIIHLIARRMNLVREIGAVKRVKNLAIYQPERWKALSETCLALAEKNQLSDEFTIAFLEAIHQESINIQEEIMRR